MTAATTAAHQLRAAPPRVTSTISTRLFGDLMALDPDLRRGVYADLSARDMTELLAVADKVAGTPYALWRDDAPGFIEDVLGESMWSTSRKIMGALSAVDQVAVPSCFSSSKTWSTSRAALWFGATRPVGTALVVTIAPIFRQVARQMWPEIRKAHGRAGMPGHIDMTQWKVPTAQGLDHVVAYGLSAPPHNEAAVQGIHCFDAETELLTDQGWLPFPKVTGDERVLTLNGDTAEWGPITKVWRHDFDGYLNVHDGDRVNFAITDQHRLLVRSRARTYRRHPMFGNADILAIKARRDAGETNAAVAADYDCHPNTISLAYNGRAKTRATDADGPRWRILPYDQLPSEFIVRRSNKWSGTSPDRFRLAPTRQGRGLRQQHHDFDFIDWATFLGWYVAEGWSHSGGGGYRCGISQKQGAKYEEIAALLDRMGIAYARSASDLTFSSYLLHDWLRTHCGTGSATKRIPECIREGSTAAIDAFLTAYGKGDGSRHTHADSTRYITSSPQLADDLHEVLCKVGRGRKVTTPASGRAGTTTTMSTTGRTFTRHRDTYVVNDPGVPVDSNVLKRNVRRERYTGKVYCVSTPHQTIMVRRKGCAMWSGNSAELLLIVDEAGGISRVIGRNLRAMATGGAKVIAIGNPPTDDDTSWFESFCLSDDTTTIPISATSTPNFTEEEAPRCRSCPPQVPAHSLAKHLIDRKWVEEAIREHGPDAPYVQAKVHARFPKGGSSRTMPYTWVEVAMEQDEPDPDDGGWRRLADLGLADEDREWLVRDGDWVRLGVDVAADGGDEFVIARTVGTLATVEHRSSGIDNEDPVNVAGKVLQHIRRAEALRARLGTVAPVRVKVDVIGVGWGVVGVLQSWASEGLHGAEIVGVDVRESPQEAKQGVGETLRPWKQRDMMWLAGRDLLRPVGPGEPGRVRLRVDKRTGAQLTGPGYGTNASGYTVVESKDSLKRKGLPSPDRAEAWLLSVFEPPEKRKKRVRIIA